MRTMQAYSRKSGARRAAVADFGKDAVEGRDYVIERQLNGRYTYRWLNTPTKPDIATTRPDRRFERAQPFNRMATMSGADKGDK